LVWRLVVVTAALIITTAVVSAAALWTIVAGLHSIRALPGHATAAPRVPDGD